MQELNATLLGSLRLTDDLYLYAVMPDSGVPEFIPGQSLALGLPNATGKIIKRAYSIASSPQEQEGLQFYIAVVQQGELTPRFLGLQQGGRLFAHHKAVGTFTLKDLQLTQGGPPNLIFVSTGTGLAPFISMLRTSTTWQMANQIVLLHGVRYESDLGYREELTELANLRTNFRYLPIVSRAPSDWAGAHGYVQSFIEKGIVELNKTSDHVFICGNPAMVETVKSLCLARDFSEHSRKQPGNLHLESYW